LKNPNNDDLKQFRAVHFQALTVKMPSEVANVGSRLDAVIFELFENNKI